MGVLYKKTGSFLTIFRRKGGGSGPKQKNPYQKKLRWSKKGEGGGLSFLTESKKNSFFQGSPKHNKSKIEFFRRFKVAWVTVT